MRDDAHLAEEAGRRRTSGRLLDAIERHTARGRMLEVGCCHGLPLDEARRRGWEVAGLELADASRAHARDALGLDVKIGDARGARPGERRRSAGDRATSATGSPGSAPLARGLATVRRLGVAQRPLTFSLGDERAVVARR
jgi:hypothetical protein